MRAVTSWNCRGFCTSATPFVVQQSGLGQVGVAFEITLLQHLYIGQLIAVEIQLRYLLIIRMSEFACRFLEFCTNRLLNSGRLLPAPNTNHSQHQREQDGVVERDHNLMIINK